jgi:hypothetical protein
MYECNTSVIASNKRHPLEEEEETNNVDQRAREPESQRAREPESQRAREPDIN